MSSPCQTLCVGIQGLFNAAKNDLHRFPTKGLGKFDTPYCAHFLVANLLNYLLSVVNIVKRKFKVYVNLILIVTKTSNSI